MLVDDGVLLVSSRAADALLEPGEEDTTLSPTPLSSGADGPGKHPGTD
ncbi:hypothetical protein ACH4GM_31150 [Streptomyces coeruleorubidus]